VTGSLIAFSFARDHELALERALRAGLRRDRAAGDHELDRRVLLGLEVLVARRAPIIEGARMEGDSRLARRRRLTVRGVATTAALVAVAAWASAVRAQEIDPEQGLVGEAEPAQATDDEAPPAPDDEPFQAGASDAELSDGEAEPSDDAGGAFLLAGKVGGGLPFNDLGVNVAGAIEVGYGGLVVTDELNIELDKVVQPFGLDTEDNAVSILRVEGSADDNVPFSPTDSVPEPDRRGSDRPGRAARRRHLRRRRDVPDGMSVAPESVGTGTETCGRTARAGSRLRGGGDHRPLHLRLRRQRRHERARFGRARAGLVAGRDPGDPGHRSVPERRRERLLRRGAGD
jgi:hypothetical protein